jgi:hypothetical protein
MQCACAMLSSVACPAIQYFWKLFHKRHDFREKKMNIKCVLRFSLQLLSETFPILRRIQRDMMRHAYCSLRGVPFVQTQLTL